MPELKLGVLFGGMSEENPVSIKSAREIARNLDPAKYDPVFIEITRDGDWRLCSSPGQDGDGSDRPPVVLSPDREVHGLMLRDGGRYRTIRLDAVLPVLHGRFGEDGAIQGLLELSGIPYVGCRVTSSALAMDKSLTYLVARSAGVATPKFRTVTGDGHCDPERLTYPVFVKPARSGSSFGVTRVDRSEELQGAVATAQQFDSKVLIEEAVVGREIGCALLETTDGLIVGEVDEIRLSHGFFRIHQEDEPERKSENSTVVVPADIPPFLRDRVQHTARVVYRALGCRGLARVDLFVTESGEVILNEVNTFPGMTSYSRYPRMMAAAGIPLPDLLDRLISFAMRGESR
ncbi:D-alanine--(R)-lactate ligase VanA-Sc [Humibacter soli]